MKEACLRREKAEEEFTELSQKSKTLEIDLDKFAEKLEKQIMAQESKEAQVLAAEAEFNRLNRRSLRKTLRSLNRSMFWLFRSMTRLLLPLMTVTEWQRFSRTELLKMKQNLLDLLMN